MTHALVFIWRCFPSQIFHKIYCIFKNLRFFNDMSNNNVHATLMICISIWRKIFHHGDRKPEYTGLVRDSRVRDWLWLWKLLAPLAHPTWGKPLRDLMWVQRFDNLSCYWPIKKERKVLLSKDIHILSNKKQSNNSNINMKTKWILFLFFF